MQDLQEIIAQAISNLWQLTPEVEVSLAPETATFINGRSADYACNVAMRLARLSMPPRQIAEQIKAELLRLAENTSLAGVEIEVAGPGFLNFILPDEYLRAKLAEITHKSAVNISPDGYSSHDISATSEPHLTGKKQSDVSLNPNILPKPYQNQTIICEFSDPNPFKVLHVGHLYTSVVGDAISRLLTAAGGKVIRANFGGDVGLHVAKNMYALLQNREEALKLNPDNTSLSLDAKAELMATCYVAGTRAYEDDDKAHAEITQLNHLIYQLVQFAIQHDYVHGSQPLTNGQIEQLVTEFTEHISQQKHTKALPSANNSFDFSSDEITTIAQIYWWGRNTSYAYFQSFYAQIGLKFDRFYPESTVADLGMQTVLAHTAEVDGELTKPSQITSGDSTYIRSDGAVVFRGEDFGLHTRVFINQNGIPTYETKDVGLIFTKWQDYHFDQSIVITGNEQTDYMKVVLKSVEQYAPELVQRTTHLTHGMVKLPGSVKMSSRKGNFLRAIDVLNLVQTTLEQTYSDKETQTKTNSNAMISLGATKYAFLKYKLGNNIDFDLKESVSMMGNSGPYLQYSAVRAKKILEKASVSTQSAEGNDGYVDLTIHERALIKQILAYPAVLSLAIADLAPHRLCSYLYELAQEFSRFYEHTQVIGSEAEEFRVHLVQTYLVVLAHGLNLLGIDVPEQM